MQSLSMQLTISIKSKGSMSPENTNMIRERVSILPPEIIELTQGELIGNTVDQIQTDFSLTSEQAVKLSNEIVLTVLFFEEISTLTQRIETELKISKKNSDKMYPILFSSIFQIIKTCTLYPTKMNLIAVLVLRRKISPPTSPRLKRLYKPSRQCAPWPTT